MNASNLPSFNSAVTPWEPTPLEAVQLSTEQVDQALTQAKQNPDPSQLWQRYIDGLAQQGFRQWLQNRAPELSGQSESNPEMLHAPLVHINGFSICLLPQSNQPDEFIEIPTALVDEAGSKAHFYVIAAIAEEQSAVEIYAVLRQEQLIQKRSLLSLDEDNTYLVPLTWFDGDIDSLLLYLRCSEPAAFAQDQTQAQAQSSGQRTELAPLLPPQLIQAAVNTALWFDGIIDEMSQQLSWALMPPPSLAAQGLAMRGEEPDSLREIDAGYQLLQTLRNQGIEIPKSLRPAIKTFEIGNQAVRLYALAWPSSDQEWELTLILGPTPDSSFPREVCLIVEDQTQQLVEEQLHPGVKDDFIFANLSAEIDEIFLAKIKLGDQIVEVLPAFSFQPGKSQNKM